MNGVIKAVIFDMDGLIVDSERLVKQSWTAAGNQLGYEKLGDNIINTLGFNIIQRELYFKNRYGADFPFPKFREYSKAAFYDAVGQKGIPAKKGLHELLEYLRNHNYKIAVATSSRDPYVANCLRDTGVIGYFQEIITGDLVERGKPYPDIYQLACKRLAVDPAACIALEDSPNGIRAARAAGINPVMVPDLIEPDEEISRLLFAKKDSLDQVIPLLAENT